MTNNYEGTFNMPTLRPLWDLVPVMLLSDMTANNATMTWLNGTVPLLSPYDFSWHAQGETNVTSDYLEVQIPYRFKLPDL